MAIQLPSSTSESTSNSVEQRTGSNDDWTTSDFVKIKQKPSKRITPYLESEIWERDKLLTLLKYEPYTRIKAILTLKWDLDSRPHVITLLKIKHIRLKEKYGEGKFLTRQRQVLVLSF